MFTVFAYIILFDIDEQNCTIYIVFLFIDVDRYRLFMCF